MNIKFGKGHRWNFNPCSKFQRNFHTFDAVENFNIHVYIILRIKQFRRAFNYRFGDFPRYFAETTRFSRNVIPTYPPSSEIVVFFFSTHPHAPPKTPSKTLVVQYMKICTNKCIFTRYGGHAGKKAVSVIGSFGFPNLSRFWNPIMTPK